MAIIFVDRKGASLRMDGSSVAVYLDSQLEWRLPCRLADRLVLVGDMSVSTAALTSMTAAGVALTIIRRGRFAVLLGGPGKDAQRRIAQYLWACDESLRSRWAARIVGAKLRAQLRLLRLIAVRRPDARARALRSLEQVSAMERQCRRPGLSLDQIRGCEGAAASAYFEALQAVFPPMLGFTNRNRRPPRDPVNAALSLGYVLAYGAASAEIHAAGFDPHLGVYHDPAHGRASLACDLIEPLRPRVDSLVWTLFSERKLRLDQFRSEGEASLLGKAGRRVFYAAWSQAEPSMTRLLRAALGALARAIPGDQSGDPSPVAFSASDSLEQETL